ncbi:AtpZ/AtpI family protein [Mucilaginibacter lutimaris]|uniref:AtpZ/AtpI family protein n=1 Tax=Mucilaginibacter lutimaris TaxID=931629 RepID=A0ABW2ZHC5_9SPHI
MAENEQKQPNDSGKAVNAYAKYTGLAFQMIAVIGIFAFAGYEIDKAGQHTTMWVTAALSLAGVFVSLYLVIRSVKN